MSTSPKTEPCSVEKCPSDVSELAELYCLKRLTPEQEERFEEHFLMCPRCTDEVRQAELYIGDVRSVLSNLPEAAPRRTRRRRA